MIFLLVVIMTTGTTSKGLPYVIHTPLGEKSTVRDPVLKAILEENFCLK